MPIVIFEAYCRLKIIPEELQRKEEQAKVYTQICDDVLLVMPRGYNNRALCASADGKYHVLAFPYLQIFLDKLEKELRTNWVENACGDVLNPDLSGVFESFKLELAKQINLCPNCKSEAMPVSLIYCSKQDEYYYPDFLDIVEGEHGSWFYSYYECAGCPEHESFMNRNFENCPHSDIHYMYWCSRCGAIYHPEKREIIHNFEDSHLEDFGDSCEYYKKFLENTKET